MIDTAKKIDFLEKVSKDPLFDVHLHRFIKFNKNIEFKIAESVIEREGAYLLRWEVFGKELGQIANYKDSIDDWDENGASALFIAKDQTVANELESVVATVRVTKSNKIRSRNGNKFGLPLEDFYDLSTMWKIASSIAQSNWFCTKKYYRNRFTSILLIKKVFQYAYEIGIDSAVIFSCLNTSNYYEAMAIYRKSVEEELLSPEVTLERIVEDHIVVGENRSLTELKKIRVPALVNLYAAIGFKICGKPLYNSKFSTYDIPMFMHYDDGPKFFLER